MNSHKLCEQPSVFHTARKPVQSSVLFSPISESSAILCWMISFIRSPPEARERERALNNLTVGCTGVKLTYGTVHNAWAPFWLRFSARVFCELQTQALTSALSSKYGSKKPTRRWSKQCQGAYVQLLSTIWIKRNHLTFLYRVVSAPREACVQEVCYTGLIWLSRIAGSETFTAETSQNAVPSFCGVPQVRNFDEMFNWSKWFNLYFEFSSVPVTPHHRPALKTIISRASRRLTQAGVERCLEWSKSLHYLCAELWSLCLFT